MQEENQLRRVSQLFIANLAAELCSPPDKEWVALSKVAPADTQELLRIAREKILPEYQRFDEASKEKIKHALEFFVGVVDSGIERIFPAFQIPLPEEAARPLFLIVWQELFHSPFPSRVDPSEYELDESSEFANSLRTVTR